MSVSAIQNPPPHIRQGEIYWVTIKQDEAKGSEQYGRRPFIVVSRDGLNRTNLKTVVAVPMSTCGGLDPARLRDQPPFRIVIPPQEITKDASCTSVIELSIAKTDQVRVLDKTRLESRIGKLSQTATISVTHGLAWVCDIR